VQDCAIGNFFGFNVLLGNGLLKQFIGLSSLIDGIDDVGEPSLRRARYRGTASARARLRIESLSNSVVETSTLRPAMRDTSLAKSTRGMTPCFAASKSTKRSMSDREVSAPRAVEPKTRTLRIKCLSAQA
jgi:hypothetical protein